ncbi:hypothetical protein ACT3TH_11430 [Psychrobacter sp. AOP22-C1-C5]|uniref:hypothetical protein n=1 Tax=Psychrobacter sp. AOP22-C1-C5 TaxID=3457716 RepID=UPI0040370DE2
MTSNKKALVGVMSIFLASCSFFDRDRGKIIVNNISPHTVSDVSFKYTSSKRVDVIGDLPANSSYRYTLNYADHEDSVYISYIDKNKKKHTENVVPYGGKYDKKKYVFTIK